jgi:hypothetical protein
MTDEQLSQTTIGADYLETHTKYPVDLLLDYLLQLIRCREEHAANWVWKVKYDNEIEATKEILKIITQ